MLAPPSALLTLALALLAAPPAAEAASSITTCAAGEYFNKTHQACYPCGVNALTCSSSTIALTCAKGYTVQNGLCLIASVTKVVTVTAGFAPTVMATVTATVVKPAATLTKTTTSTTTQAARTSTVSSTTTILTAATVTAPVTVTKVTTATSTSTPVSTTHTTVAAGTTALSTVRNAKFTYGGCYLLGSVTAIADPSVGTVHIDSPLPSLYTASTAVAACYAQLAAFMDSLPAASKGQPVQCIIKSYAIYLQTSTVPLSTVTPLADSECLKVCPWDGSPDVRAEYSEEYCGGTYGQYSVFDLNVSL